MPTLDSVSKQGTGQINLRLASSPISEAEADVDIVAIHGLGTTSPDTWIWKKTQGNTHGVNWLEDSEMLLNKVGSARIFTSDWPANLFVSQDSIQPTIIELARNLLLDIRSKLGEIDRPILFIASCLGGIIVTQAVVDAAKQNSDYHSLWRATRGIVFLATPFRGTAFQDIAILAVASMNNVARLAGQSLTTLLDSVKGSTPFLEELVGDFTSEI